MSSNLFKANWVVLTDDTRVIDTNELAAQKLQQAALIRSSEPVREQTEDFQTGLDAENVELLLDTESEDAVHKSASAEELSMVRRELEEARADLEQVRKQADKLLADAQNEAEAMKLKLIREFQEQGYQEGYEQGKKEALALKQEYLTKQQELEQDYLQKIEALEPEFVENLTSIYEHIFKVDLCDYRGLVVNLLTDAMQKTEGTGNYIVHVAREDFPQVSAAKEEILEQTGTPAERLEIVSDMTLSLAQCMIETEGGVYDCSLGTELKELKRKLMLLSYKGGK